MHSLRDVYGVNMQWKRVRIKHDGLVHVVNAWRVRNGVGIVNCFMGFRLGEHHGYESYYEASPTTDAATCVECAAQ